MQSLAAIAGLFIPWLLGNLVASVTHGHDTVLRTVLLIVAFLAAQAILSPLAGYAAAALGEKVLAGLREDFVADVLALRPEIVEDVAGGDLITRTTRDVDLLSNTVRAGVPQILTASGVILFTLGALILVSPLLTLPCLIAVPVLFGALRWYLRRAHQGYLREAATYSRMTESLAETVEGARTVEALRLAARRIDRVNEDIATSYAAERYTLRLRSVFMPAAEASYVLPLAGTLAFGGYAYLRGWCTIGQVTAGALYATALVKPMDELIQWLNQLQTGAAALARLLGVEQVAADREPGGERPRGEELVADAITHAYRPGGREVLKSVSLRIRPGERIAIVGPSGAGKSTLGRILAGITAPSAGRVTVGGVELTRLPLDELRGRVALVSQEHHIFRGTLRENLTLGLQDACDEQVLAALAAVEATGWADALPGGLDCVVGSGGAALSSAQAQQVALARLILADPHTLILDEATSLLDPRSARRLERSMAAVLDGRTVVSIAHRLHVGHDADRVIVMENGEIRESGPHRELVQAGGAYAALWESWHGAARSADAPSAVSSA
jgi:ABC-type multidrug transport system fused ATPase/permease subunit